LNIFNRLEKRSVVFDEKSIAEFLKRYHFIEEDEDEKDDENDNE
jgi:hypothetical protein